jgi:pimeloyl-ACP methyl ester carboxylesterase
VNPPRIVGTDFGGPATGKLLLLGPSLDTSANTLWAAAAERLAERAHVVGWDLPGHGSTGSARRFPTADATSDRRSRSLITLTAMVARGHHDELAMHVRAARRNGLTNDEIKELLLQTAVYCGVPDANSAFRIANQVLVDYDEPEAQR